MAASVVGICNSALLKIGAERISSLSDDNKRAIACNEQYAKLRDEVLADHPWNFALKRATLAADATAPNWGYARRFPLPSDCLRVIETQYPNQIYKIESGFILTDESDIKILYVFQQTDVTKFSAKFCEALSLRIAADLAYHLAQSASLSQQLLASYSALLADARAVDAQEGSPAEMVVDEWTGARL